MRARRIALIRARAWARQFVGARARVARDVQTGVVIHPVDEAVLEDGVGARDPLRHRQRVTYFARRVRIRDVDDAQAVRVPGREHEVLEDRRIVILLWDATTRLTVWLCRRLRETFLDLIIGNRKC